MAHDTKPSLEVTSGESVGSPHSHKILRAPMAAMPRAWRYALPSKQKNVAGWWSILHVVQRRISISDGRGNHAQEAIQNFLAN
ncbi:MAG: hypothetical protein U1E36_05110 [Rickettsiales bacterium]